MAEAAHYCSLSDKTLRRVIARGELRHYRPGRQILIDVQDLDSFIERSVVESVDLLGLVVSR